MAWSRTIRIKWYPFTTNLKCSRTNGKGNMTDFARVECSRLQDFHWLLTGKHLNTGRLDKTSAEFRRLLQALRDDVSSQGLHHLRMVTTEISRKKFPEKRILFAMFI